MNDESDESDDDEDFADDESFASVDHLEGMFFQCLGAHCKHGSADEGAAHMHALSKLAEKDPEFYKYLQDNDRDLLEFGPEDAVDESEEEEDVEMESETLPILTKDILRGWQKALLDARPPCLDPGFR
jgi:nucleolar complex protein 2